jgi:hypothetical protein
VPGQWWFQGGTSILSLQNTSRRLKSVAHKAPYQRALALCCGAFVFLEFAQFSYTVSYSSATYRGTRIELFSGRQLPPLLCSAADIAKSINPNVSILIQGNNRKLCRSDLNELWGFSVCHAPPRENFSHTVKGGHSSRQGPKVLTESAAGLRNFGGISDAAYHCKR